MKKTFKCASVLLALTLAVSLGACGAPATETPKESAAKPETADTAADTTAITIKVGASPAPHSELLEQIKPVLEKQGVNLEIVDFTDYVLPNKALDAGDIDANYFQHKPYLDNFNTENGTKLVSAAAIHFEPLGIYPGKTAALDALTEGAIIAVPNDPTNEARALLLLQKLGLITLADGAGLEATPLDVKENTKKIKFQEMEAAQLPNVLPDVDFAVINGNYAVGAGIADKVLTTEDKDSEAAKEFANIIAVRAGDETRPEIVKLIAALQSETTAKFINEKYNGTVIPVF